MTEVEELLAKEKALKEQQRELAKQIKKAKKQEESDMRAFNKVFKRKFRGLTFSKVLEIVDKYAAEHPEELAEYLEKQKNEKEAKKVEKAKEEAQPESKVVEQKETIEEVKEDAEKTLEEAQPESEELEKKETVEEEIIKLEGVPAQSFFEEETSEPKCERCGHPVGEDVVDFCRKRADRFGGKILCRNCQRG